MKLTQSPCRYDKVDYEYANYGNDDNRQRVVSKKKKNNKIRYDENTEKIREEQNVDATRGEEEDTTKEKDANINNKKSK